MLHLRKIHFIIFVVNFIGLNLRSQSSIGIVPSSISILPGDTVIDGTTINIYGNFKKCITRLSQFLGKTYLTDDEIISKLELS